MKITFAAFLVVTNLMVLLVFYSFGAFLAGVALMFSSMLLLWHIYGNEE